MDIPSKHLLTDILVDWMETGDRSIIIASHQIDDIKKLSDYLFVLHDGKMIGHFEKETLLEKYARYWIQQLPESTIPGVVSRAENIVISNNPQVTEEYLIKNNIKWTTRSALELEDVITLLLTKTTI